MQLFARLTKVDVAKRQVTGIIASETPDKANEILDYASSKPHFEKWSNDMAKASGGKNIGNVRVMHGLVAAGQLNQITFHDDAKQVEATAEIVDDNEWKKVEAGTYTGFSVGGKYVRKWNDNGVTRYTARPSEVSLVDAPCIPDATFELVKADGSMELRKFAAPAEATEATAIEADIFAGVKDTLAKIAKRKDTKPSEGEAKYGDVAYADEKNKKYPIDTPAHIRAAWNYINKASNAGKYDSGDVATIKKKIIAAWKDKIDKAGPPSAEGEGDAKKAWLDCVGSMLMQKIEDPKLLEGLALAKEIVRGQALEKGMYTCASLCRLLEDLGYIQSSVACEARYEDDGSPLPADLAEAAKEIGRILISMVEEEVEELGEGADEAMMALADKPEDLKKVENPTPELLGAVADNLAKAIGERDDLKKRFDAAEADLQKALGAISESNAALAKLTGERDDLQKRFDASEATIKELNQKLKAPARTVSKEGDVIQENSKDEVKKVMNGEGEIDPAATVFKAIHATGGQRFG
jgi:predicted  nucleic acid-binding Zn-ribbon protein